MKTKEEILEELAKLSIKKKEILDIIDENIGSEKNEGRWIEHAFIQKRISTLNWVLNYELS